MADLAQRGREMLARLVAFDTTSRNSNLALIGFVEDWLGRLGVATHRVANDDGSKTNLYATIGPMVPGGVVLSGHTDVVPVDGQPWTSDPFTLTEREGRLYGRGTCDMKGFIALALAARPRIVIADSGMNQLRRTRETKRRSQGPNSTPFVSNWMVAPGSFWPPCGLSNVSFCT